MNKFIYNKRLFKRFFTLTSLLFTVPFLSAQESSAPINNQQNVASLIKKISPESIQFTVDDDFSLSGDFYPSDLLGAGVLLLHDCSHSSKSYSVFGKLLAKQGINALAIDFRGYGDSTSELFSNNSLKLKLKKTIREVLDSYQDTELNIASEVARDILAEKIHREVSEHFHYWEIDDE